MENKPTIAIIGGTGNEGPGLALRWALGGYPVIIGSRVQEKAETTAETLNNELGINSIIGMQNSLAAQNADISVLTVVYTAHHPALESIKNDLQGKILIDATARIDFRNPKPPEPPSAARIAQNILGEEVQVAAAFQNVPAHVLRKDLNKHLEADVLVFADAADAAESAISLTEAGGMRAYHAGGLDNAIVAEGLTSILISLNKIYGVRTASIGINGLEK
jgi:NADPH-dependent F420 reductase